MRVGCVTLVLAILAMLTGCTAFARRNCVRELGPGWSISHAPPEAAEILAALQYPAENTKRLWLRNAQELALCTSYGWPTSCDMLAERVYQEGDAWKSELLAWEHCGE
jgi:hypothetical protein